MKTVQPNAETATLDEAVEWLNYVIGYLTETEIEKCATRAQIRVIWKLAEKASAILESES